MRLADRKVAKMAAQLIAQTVSEMAVQTVDVSPTARAAWIVATTAPSLVLPKAVVVVVDVLDEG